MVRWIKPGICCAVACGLLSMSPMVHADDGMNGMVVVEGISVPDIAPLPAYVPTPPTNLSYVQKVELGKQLYFDTRLSKNNSVSCAFCHNPGTGFADARQFSIGAFGTAGGRQAPTVYNTGFLPLQFWDGRAGSLEEQAIGPIHNPIEMAETHETVVPKIAKIPGYQNNSNWSSAAARACNISRKRSRPSSGRSCRRTAPSTSTCSAIRRPWTRRPCAAWRSSKARPAVSSAITG